MKIWNHMVCGLILSLLEYTPCFAQNCLTHQPCYIGQECKCTIPANSAYYRYYYFDISTLNQDQHYQCEFSSTYVTFTIDLTGSTFPEGVSYRCLGNCPSFPVTLFINASMMQDPQGKMIIKYFVPASDYVSNAMVKCIQVN